MIVISHSEAEKMAEGAFGNFSYIFMLHGYPAHYTFIKRSSKAVPAENYMRSHVR